MYLLLGTVLFTVRGECVPDQSCVRYPGTRVAIPWQPILVCPGLIRSRPRLPSVPGPPFYTGSPEATEGTRPGSISRLTHAVSLPYAV